MPLRQMQAAWNGPLVEPMSIQSVSNKKKSLKLTDKIHSNWKEQSSKIQYGYLSWSLEDTGFEKIEKEKERKKKEKVID